MKLSNLYMPTAKEAPSDAELASHKLMLRAALIHKLGSGLYSWLPLGLRVLHKVESIIREEMSAIGAQEVLMPAVQPKELWQESGRWEQFGPQLLKMTDRQKREFCYGPTHEEVITDLVRHDVKSYKQLPFSLYQIQTKFRDEIRPRFGVMRAREFLMKDGYSFHDSQESLSATYDEYNSAYNKIFTRIGLKYRVVEADTGSIGGSKSEEFHALAESGEDILVYSENSSYAANIEKAASKKELREPAAPTLDLEKTATPGIKSVPEQAKYMKLDEKQILKTLIVKGATDDSPAVALLVRGDHELNAIKAEKIDEVASPLTFVDEKELSSLCGCEPGFVGPMGLDIPVIADTEVGAMSDFSCGANENDYHYIGVNWGRDLPKPIKFTDLTLVKEGDMAPDGSGPLKFARGSELGHIFQLGKKYSEALGATVLNKEGKPIPMLMGCYGIGVSRIVAATIEQCHDDNGICWPDAITPFSLAIVPIGYHKDDSVANEANKLYTSLSNEFECLIDDRNIRPGISFKDIELIGIPHRLVISAKSIANGSCEYKRRVDGYSTDLKLETVFELNQQGKLKPYLEALN